MKQSKGSDGSAAIVGLVGLFALACAGAAVWLTAVPAAPRAQPLSPEAADRLATCLSARGAVMYGAAWCPHCQEQKKEFGASFPKVKYVECSLGATSGSGENPACAAAGIKGYPTWVFADGSRAEGGFPLPDLAKAAGCAAETAPSALTGSAVRQ